MQPLSAHITFLLFFLFYLLGLVSLSLSSWILPYLTRYLLREIQSQHHTIIIWQQIKYDKRWNTERRVDVEVILLKKRDAWCIRTLFGRRADVSCRCCWKMIFSKLVFVWLSLPSQSTDEKTATCYYTNVLCWLKVESLQSHQHSPLFLLCITQHSWKSLRDDSGEFEAKQKCLQRSNLVQKQLIFQSSTSFSGVARWIHKYDLLIKGKLADTFGCGSMVELFWYLEFWSCIHKYLSWFHC